MQFALFIFLTSLDLFNIHTEPVCYLKITDLLSTTEFEKVKEHILQNGDRKTFSNRQNNNPHLSIDDFDIFLSPADRNNMECDPSVSDFNEIIVYDRGAKIQYYCIYIVRGGDKQNETLQLYDGMEGNNVYLLNPYQEDIKELEQNFKKEYLIKIHKFILNK